MNISYCHRTIAGVSIGATNINNKLIVAAALTNDGTTRSGIWRKERHDQFARKIAHKIINGRIQTAQSVDQEPDFTIIFETDLTAKTFMNQFRAMFKPFADESDDLLYDVGEIGEVEYRIRKRADAIWDIVANISNEIVIEANKAHTV